MRSIKEVIEQSGYLDNGIEELTMEELYILMMEYGGDVIDECIEITSGYIDLEPLLKDLKEIKNQLK